MPWVSWRSGGAVPVEAVVYLAERQTWRTGSFQDRRRRESRTRKAGGGSEVRHRPEVNPPLSPTVDGLLGNEDDATYQLKIIHMKLIDCPSESLAPSLTREAVFGPQTRVHPVSVPAETG